MNSVNEFVTALELYKEVEASNTYDRSVIVGMLCQNEDYQVDIQEILCVLQQSVFKMIGVNIID